MLKDIRSGSQNMLALHNRNVNKGTLNLKTFERSMQNSLDTNHFLEHF